ncbi:MAG: hypothetical protein AAF990_28630 [Bacteroidota bacterium]
MNQYKKIDVNPFNSITSILFLVLVLVGLYFIAKGVFTILSWLAPVLLILALVLNYRVVLNYGKWLINLLQKNILMGLGAILLTVVGFPVIAGFLAVKAYLYRKVDQFQSQAEQKVAGEYVDFEEVDEIPETPLELPPLERPRRPSAEKDDNDYDRFFNNKG